jgi:tetratricopeptide repeat protein
MTAEWEQRVADLWATFDDYDVDEFLRRMDALVDAGREREAVSVALLAVSRHMTRYQRSLTHYARAIADPE